MGSINDTLIKAMQEVAQSAVDKAGFDKTRTCMIMSTANTNNTYTVNMDGIEYTNIPCYGNGSFSVGDVTKIYIPNNQMSQAYIGGAGGGISDAPSDNKQYARKNGAWDEVSSPTDVLKYTAQTLTDEQKTQARTNIGAIASSHTQAASTITAGELGGAVTANDTAVGNVGTAQVRNIYVGTTDMVAGETALSTGDLYFVYQ